MRTLIYKRTHNGDPDAAGRFGIRDCMGQVRSWGFEAVIGVGGIGAEPRSHGLDGKANWIGIGPHKGAWRKRGPIITFDHFLYYGSAGPSFVDWAPHLAHRIYSRKVRVLMNGISPAERKEVDKLLALAKDAPPSSPDGAPKVKTSVRCRPGWSSRKPVKDC